MFHGLTNAPFPCAGKDEILAAVSLSNQRVGQAGFRAEPLKRWEGLYAGWEGLYAEPLKRWEGLYAWLGGFVRRLFQKTIAITAFFANSDLGYVVLWSLQRSWRTTLPKK
jgi:hypothetical protein